MRKVKLIAVAVVLVATISMLFWADYQVFRMKHPEAPSWTYIFE